MASARVDVGGFNLAVHESGSGPAVLVLHGFTGNAGSMRVATDTLAANHRVLAVDLVGHGESDAPHEVGPYAMDACVGQLVRVLDACAVERAALVGYSMGGRTALQLAAAHPDRVASLLLVGASAGLADASARADRVRSDEALADEIERDGVEAFVDRWMALPLFASQKRLGGDALAEARAQRLTNRAHGLANSLRGMGTGAQRPLHDGLEQLATPTCFAVGDEDAKFRAIADELAARMPRARVAVVEEAGHAAHLENPEAFARLAQEFLASATPPGASA